MAQQDIGKYNIINYLAFPTFSSILGGMEKIVIEIIPSSSSYFCKLIKLQKC